MFRYMTDCALILPHQLFRQLPFAPMPAYLVEEALFFRQFRFHKQKIAFHRASMKAYADYLAAKGYEVRYIASTDAGSDVRLLLQRVCGDEGTTLHCYDPVDDWIQRRIGKNASSVVWYRNPSFLLDKADLHAYFGRELKSFHMADFYALQRKKFRILMDGSKPVGGKWSFDADNRKRYPAKATPPPVRYPDADAYFREAVSYTHTHFSENPGMLSEGPLYPTNFEEADRWLDDFLENRFHGFGPYEDSIVANESILHHSVLSPLLNAGLLEPGHVLERILAFAEQHDVPLNSTEGLVRQLLGWREFVRGVYEYRGRQQRTSNRLGHTRALPASFYDGTTGIPPIDQTIRKLLKTGYVHHIERLMVLSNFMNLCGFDPNAVYQWFMELFIDAYDWVMVPNVYGMALFADGGMMSTKPYVSGSNYIRKMSDYKSGEWETIWDALFWTFMDRHRPVFGKNPRLRVLMSHWDKMDGEKKASLVAKAEVFLSRQF